MIDLNLINLGWLFFTAWTVILAALSLDAFGPDLLDDFATTKRPRARHLK